MNQKRNFKRSGFTLVEMLIVIVIIGILASALIPKLQSARGKANDVARKANLNQVATALMSYNIDKGYFPTVAGGLSAISGDLIYAGMSSVPKDPDAGKNFLGIQTGAGACSAGNLSPDGEFMYTPARKGSINGASYIIMAGSETEGGANYIQSGTIASHVLCSETEISTIPRCEAGTCIKAGDNLRYIVTY